MEITKETRLESYIKTSTSKRCRMILECMGTREMTARMIASELGFTDLNAVKPRLSELKDKGVIETTGKAYDMTTKRNVALFKRII